MPRHGPLPPQSPASTTARPDVVEVGYTRLAASAQRTRCNTEAKYLLCAYAFEVWEVHRVSLRRVSVARICPAETVLYTIRRFIRLYRPNGRKCGIGSRACCRGRPRDASQPFNGVKTHGKRGGVIWEASSLPTICRRKLVKTRRVPVYCRTDGYGMMSYRVMYGVRSHVGRLFPGHRSAAIRDRKSVV